MHLTTWAVEAQPQRCTSANQIVPRVSIAQFLCWREKAALDDMMRNLMVAAVLALSCLLVAEAAEKKAGPKVTDIVRACIFTSEYNGRFTTLL